MKPTRLAVIGTGHLGRFHARLACQHDDAQLVAIVEADETTRILAAEETGAEPLSDISELAGKVDAAIVATPTETHREIGGALIEQGIHVFIEKPLAADLEEADELVNLAQRHGVVLQVGHVERFNPALTRALPHLTGAKYVEAVRISGYPFRSADIGVVHDLMIHDLDIILSITKASVRKVEALGLSILGKHEDSAQARIVFDDGCVANLTASRVSYQSQRTMQVWTPEGFAHVDFGLRTTTVLQPGERIRDGLFNLDTLTAEEKNHYKRHFFEELFTKETIEGAEGNALLDEQRDLVHCVRSGASPRVTGEQGREVLALADQILLSIDHHQWDGKADGRVGPMSAWMPAPILRSDHWNLSSEEAQPRREAG